MLIVRHLTLPGRSRVGVELPAAASGSAAELGAELAAGVFEEQLAGVEVMHGRGARAKRRKVALELRIVGASPPPQGPTIRNLVEEQELLDPAIAVRGNDQHLVVGQAQDDVMVELALRPVIDQRVSTVLGVQTAQQVSQTEVLAERSYIQGHRISLASVPRRRRLAGKSRAGGSETTAPMAFRRRRWSRSTRAV